MLAGAGGDIMGPNNPTYLRILGNVSRLLGSRSHEEFSSWVAICVNKLILMDDSLTREANTFDLISND